MTLNLDMAKVSKLIIAHEFGEIYGGDITPNDNIPAEEKNHIETSSFHRLFDGTPWEESYKNIWEEYSAQETPESRFVAQIDKLEMAFQAAIYQLQYKQDFTDILTSPENCIFDLELAGLLREIQAIAGTAMKSFE